MMLLKVTPPNQHFKSYFQENSLLIQLILKELNDICIFIADLKSMHSLDLMKQEEWLNSLHNSLNGLIGEHDEGVFSGCKKGPLARLKSYCQHFQLIDIVQDKSLLNFSFQVNQIYITIKQLCHFLHSYEVCHHSRKKHSIFAKIQKNAQFVLTTLENILKLFLTCLKKFANNENVLFFLLRKKALLIKIYGLKITNQLFKTFSKKECISILLIQRFKSRGFDHLLPIIKRELFFYESNQNTAI